MKTPLCLPALLIAGACASQPPSEEALGDRQYQRDAARIEAAEEFERDKAECRRTGGAMVVNRTFSRRLKSSRADVRLATCVPGRAGAIL
jgi:hypothetical protein